MIRRKKQKPRVPLVYCDDLPQISLPEWMQREREHVLVKQNLEIQSRYDDIKKLNRKLKNMQEKYRNSSPIRTITQIKKKFHSAHKKYEYNHRNNKSNNKKRRKKPIGKSYSTGNINLRDRRIHDKSLNAESFKLPNISIPNSSLTLVSFVPERDIHTPEVNMDFTFGMSPSPKDNNMYQTKEAMAIEANIKQIESTIEKKKVGFKRQIDYIEKPLFVARSKHLQERQESWIKLMYFIKGIKIKTNALKKYRAELEAMQELNLACARIQSTFRSAFVRKANKKMERVARLLREKAWIARLNVRTGKRRKEAMIVRRFIIAASKISRFSTIVRKYRARVVFCQRFIRSFFTCQNARLRAMSKKWRLLEKKIVAFQTIQDNEEEKRIRRKEALLQAKAAKKARSVAAQKKEKRMKNMNREFRLLVRDVKKMATSLDSISYRTRIGADEDDPVAIAMKKEEARRKKRMMNRTTSKSIRYKVLKGHLKRKRYRFIMKKLDYINEEGTTGDNIKVKLTKDEMQLFLKGEVDPNKILEVKRNEIIKERNGRMLIIYQTLGEDLPKLIRKGLKLQKAKEKAELKKALQG